MLLKKFDNITLKVILIESIAIGKIQLFFKGKDNSCEFLSILVAFYYFVGKHWFAKDLEKSLKSKCLTRTYKKSHTT